MVLVVLGSGLRPACTDWSAFGPMLISEMEAVLKSLDQRVGRIEQILPTLDDMSKALQQQLAEVLRRLDQR